VTARLPIGQLLVEKGHLDPWQLQSALAHQQRWGGRLGEAVASLGFLPERVVLAEVAAQLGVGYLESGERTVAPEVVALVPERLIRARRVFPLGVAPGGRRGTLVVATPEPQDLTALDEVAFATGMTVRAVLSSVRDVERLIARHLDHVAFAPRGEVELPPDVEFEMAVVPFAQAI
jgi:hypothetical protein